MEASGELTFRPRLERQEGATGWGFEGRVFQAVSV